MSSGSLSAMKGPLHKICVDLALLTTIIGRKGHFVNQDAKHTRQHEKLVAAKLVGQNA
jgi:hypothetical protein